MKHRNEKHNRDKKKCVRKILISQKCIFWGFLERDRERGDEHGNLGM
jgi:hypothetical protein